MNVVVSMVGVVLLLNIVKEVMDVKNAMVDVKINVIYIIYCIYIYYALEKKTLENFFILKKKRNVF